MILSDGTGHRFNMLGQYKGLTSATSEEEEETSED